MLRFAQLNIPTVLFLMLACSSGNPRDETLDTTEPPGNEDIRNEDILADVPSTDGPLEVTMDNSAPTDLLPETVEPSGVWPVVSADSESSALLDLLRYAWGGVAGAAVTGTLETTATGSNWEQRKGTLAMVAPTPIFGSLLAPLLQLEGVDQCELQVEDDTLLVVAKDAVNEMTYTIVEGGLEAAFLDIIDGDSLAVDSVDFAAHCVDVDGDIVALSKVLTLADDGAKVALVEGGLAALGDDYDGAAALLIESKALLCCGEGIYLTGFKGAFGAIAKTGDGASGASCMWQKMALPDACEDACATAEDCREAVCSDGQDNDQDGAADCVDQDCVGQVCDDEGTVCTDGKCACEATGAEVCIGGADEDCDGKVDCADNDCAGQSCDDGDFVCTGGKCKCPSAVEDCGDDVDNNCDGDIDCDDIQCLNQPCGADGEVCVMDFLLGGSCECPNPGPEVSCGDGEDNDCDGETDCGDDDCLGKLCGVNDETCQLDDNQAPVCQCIAKVEKVCGDGKDNDCDGKTDCLDVDDCAGEPCGDFGRVCDAGIPGFEPSCQCPGLDDEENCGDGNDDDCDGDTDCADVDCADSWCTQTGKVCNAMTGECECPLGEVTESTCSDFEDNDCDGVKDCEDDDCLGKFCDSNGMVCMVVMGIKGCACPGNVDLEENCSDGVDDECDGKIDCVDDDCLGVSCGPGKYCDAGGTCTCLETEVEESLCADGLDNDCDGKIDCEDDDCPAVNCCLKGGLDCQNMACAKDCTDAGGIVGNQGQCWQQSTCDCVDDGYEPNDEWDLAQEFPLQGDSGSIDAIYCPGADFLGQDFFDVEMNLGDSFMATLTVKGGTPPFDNPLSWAPPSDQNGLPLFPTASSQTSWTVMRNPLGTSYFSGDTSGFVSLIIQASTRFSYTLDWTIERCSWDELEINNTLATAAAVEKGKNYDLTICQDDVDFLSIGTIMPNQKLTVTIQYTPGDYAPAFGWNIYLFKGTDDSGVSGTYATPKSDPSGTAVWSYSTGPSETITDARLSISGDSYFTQNPNYTFSFEVVDKP